jgi:tetratricopeptide (TPR) repeat protein
MSITAKTVSSKQWDTEAAMRKADYLYLQAIDALSGDDVDDYSLMIQQANRLSPNDVNISGQLGILTLATNAGDSAKVMQAYDQLRALYLSNPNDYDTGNSLANVAYQLRNFDDLEMVWKNLDSIYPNRNEPAFNLANVYLAKHVFGDTTAFKKAIAIYNRLEDGYGVDPGISSYKIRAYSLRRDTVSIIKELRHLENAMPNNSDAVLFIGQTYAALEMPDSALTYYDKACALDSVSGEIYLVRADFFDKQGDAESYDREVFRALESPTLEFDDKMDLLTHYVASLYKDRSQQTRIENLFNTIQEVNPGESRVHQLYAAYLAEIKETERAAEQYSYAISLDPSDMDNWGYLMSAYSQLEQYDKEIEVGKEASKRFETTTLFPLMTANALRLTDRPKEALAVIDSFDISKFDNKIAISNYYSTRGDICYALGDKGQAFADYEKALEANPENYMAMNNIAYYICLSDSADMDKAERYATMAVRAEPHNQSSLDTYAWIKFRQKDYKTAREYIDKAISEFGVHGAPDGWQAILDDSLTVIEVADTTAVVDADTTAIDDADIVISPEDFDEIEDMLEPLTLDDLIKDMGSELLEHAGDIYFMTGEPEIALQFWKLALAQNEDNELLKKKVKHKTYFFK